MAPLTTTFPVHELPEQIQHHTVKLKPKRRKVRDFDLETCPLFELVQYSCTPPQQADGRVDLNQKMQCYPFVRLFRRCGQGEKTFHIETTAWEGEHAYTGPKTAKHPHAIGSEALKTHHKDKEDSRPSWSFAEYGGYFWSNK